MAVYTEKPDKNFSSETFTDPRSAEICKYFYEILNEIPADCWVAGGAIVSKFLNQQIKDVDLYFKNEVELSKAIDFFKLSGAEVRFETDFSINAKYKNIEYDLVKITNGDIKKCINSFDMRCCSVAINKEGKLYYVSGFFDDLNNKIIKLNKNAESFSTPDRILCRLNKYGLKGFYLSKEEGEKFFTYINKCNGSNNSVKKNYSGIQYHEHIRTNTHNNILHDYVKFI